MKIVGTVRLTAFQLACNLPRNAQFREWAASFIPGGPVTADEAAEFIRIVCQIESRRQLEHDAGAAERFHQFIRKPFLAWREMQHQPLRRAA